MSSEYSKPEHFGHDPEVEEPLEIPRLVDRAELESALAHTVEVEKERDEALALLRKLRASLIDEELFWPEVDEATTLLRKSPDP